MTSSLQTPSLSACLPAPRVVITNLINSLTSASAPPPSPNTAATGGAGDAQNPLRSLPQSRRPLLITLHVLFPSMVLPALDLLDRNLITRVVPEPASPSGRGRGGDDPADPAPSQRPHDAGAADAQGSSPPFPSQDSPHPEMAPQSSSTAFYLVRSVASTMTRRGYAVATSASASTTYLVRLDAWNCTCASFAFEAFPASTATAEDFLEDEIRNADAGEDSDEGEMCGWQFGGLSQDGVDSGDVPCCKHLLACLLSEQWGDALGKYVTEKRVSREEMAGLVAEI
ncbi:hypothetical protein LX36DRAFT_94208 [Colletotrichum falcatum]|nr:hypothetical protein LX36DRAFT_94208 [Colletotrichum falcatum]